MKKIIYRADGGKKLGMGHLVRGMSIAEALPDHSAQFVFSTRDIHDMPAFLRSKGFDVWPIPPDMSPGRVAQEIYTMEPAMVINDVQNSPPDYMKLLKNGGFPIMNFDDIGEGAPFADFLIDANVSDETLYISDGGPKRYYGGQYMVLKRQFAELHKKGKTINDKVDKVLIIMGGSDPCNLTEHVILSLDSISPDFEVIAISGFGFSKREILREMAERRSWLKIVETPKSVGELMFGADIAFCSGGISMYELACVGTPAIVLCQMAHEIDNADVFVEKGINECLGIGENAELNEIVDCFLTISSFKEKRMTMRDAGKKYIDGKGLERITRIIEQCVMQLSL